MSNLPFRGSGAGRDCGCGGVQFSILPSRRPGGGGAAGGPAVTSACGNVAKSDAYCDDGCCPVEGTPPTSYTPGPLDMTAQPVYTPI